ncbi:MAG: exodeoxyribonuclease VII large subunit [Candidatus Pelagadaptatus aseana]|uniref:exodeoxyribonuclease VII large subunit n=1 Tax=Candidatus Pelagadaptatus aseana TaxID=3120508 RepID=UPI0039B2E70C
MQRDILTVTQLNRKARQLLETHMALLWIEGELSSFARPSSGHWYFTLKDAGAQVRCAMFRNRNQLVKQPPQQGQQVLVRARVSLYEGRGDYQLIVEHMEDAGQGAMHRAFDQMKMKLLHEGLFNEERKQSLPKLPNHIGVITSPTGAAIRDILHVLERRFASIPVSIFPVAVQGNDAAPQIVKALDTANRLSDCDVLIVGRGGGSLEDLWPFNEETVARAIAASRIPIVSAVGHETDFTIADFVADYRAPTPSAAAEILSPDGEALLQQFYNMEALLEEVMQRKLQYQQEKLIHLQARLQHPGQKLQAQSQTLDFLENRLHQAMAQKLQSSAIQLQQTQSRLHATDPAPYILHLKEKVEQLNDKLNTSMQHLLHNRQQQFAQQVALLNSLNPLNTLQRGYSVTRDTQGKVIHSAKQLQTGDTLETTLADGRVVSEVTDLNN